MSIPLEIWTAVTVPGFEHYEVSSLGNVRSGLAKTAKSQRRGLPLALYSDVNGYVYVNLSSPVAGKIKPGVHRLVAMAFIPNPENKEIVNHKDGKKWHNAASNLEWVTSSENTQHAIDNGLMHCQNAVEAAGLSEFFFDDYKKCIEWLAFKYKMQTAEVVRFIKKRQHNYLK